jgi:integrase/recombinase XerD
VELLSPVVETNGNLKNKVTIKGQTEVHPEGTYYIEWWQEGKRKREAIPDRARVLDFARQKAIALEAVKAGMQVAEAGQDPGAGPKTAVAVAIQEFLKDVEPPQREPKTYAAYKYCLELFQADCSKSYIQDIGRQDLLLFIRKVCELGCGARTAYNRGQHRRPVSQLNGVTGLLHKRDWPVYVDAIRKIYETDELNALFAACTPSQKVR